MKNSHRAITSISGLIRNIQLINEELVFFKLFESPSITNKKTASKHHDTYSEANSVSKPLGLVKPNITPLVAKVIYDDGKISISPIKWCQDNE